MTKNFKWTIFIAAVSATLVWYEEYPLDFPGGLPTMRWWFAAIRTWASASGGGAVDYLASIILPDYAPTSANLRRR